MSQTSSASGPARYARQIAFAPIGRAGQARLGDAGALLIGCGALGTVLAEQLVRAGIGRLTIVDRDIVELSNLHRQTLFDESDAAAHSAKSVAAAARLRRINSTVEAHPIVADVDAANIESFLDSSGIDLLLDATDNAETRYVLNDAAVKHNIPWIYGAAVASEGRVMPVIPARTPCLRCVFPHPPAPGQLATCDSAGILPPAAAVVAAMQAALAIQILAAGPATIVPHLVSFDLWTQSHRQFALSAPDPNCPTCAQRHFEFLDHPVPGGAARLCGQNAIHIRPPQATHLDLTELAQRLARNGPATSSEQVLHWLPDFAADLSLTIFADGRMTVHGTGDIAKAKSLYSQYIGN